MADRFSAVVNGVFYGRLPGDEHLSLLRRAQAIADAELAVTPRDTERHRILSAIHKSLNCAHISKFINDETSEGFSLSLQELDWLSKHESRQWIDYLLCRYKFKMYPARHKLLDFPLHLLIEPTSVCNLRCVMCFQIDSTFTRPENMGMMPWDLFIRIVDQAKEYRCSVVTLASRGEPTLHKQFGEMLQYLAAAGISDVKINTNATRLTENLCHNILSANISQVVFSVDAAKKDAYESIRVGGKFDEVVRNIERFNNIRATGYPKSATSTRVCGVLVQKDQDEKEMYDFWSQYVDQVAVVGTVHRWDSYSNEKVSSTTPCNLLWERMYVWYDGKANPCDFDYKSYLAVGDARRCTISEIWKGEAFSRLREAHLNRKRSTYVPCDRCPF